MSNDDYGDERYTIRGSVLDEAKRIITGDRNVSYGPPDVDFTRTVGMLNALFSQQLNAPFKPEDVAKILMCVKLSRSIHSEGRDHMLDLCGYAACAWECIELRHQRESRQEDATAQVPQHTVQTEPCT